MPSLHSELSNELPLRPPVAFTKRMDGIDFAKIERRARSEFLGSQATQKPFCFQF